MANDTRIVQLHKSGSSHVVTVAPVFCRALGVKRGDQLVMWVDPKGTLCLRRMKAESYLALRK